MNGLRCETYDGKEDQNASFVQALNRVLTFLPLAASSLSLEERARSIFGLMGVENHMWKEYGNDEESAKAWYVSAGKSSLWAV